MALKLKGSTSGFTAIDAPATAGDNTLVLPADNGSASQFLQTNGSGVLSWATVTDTDTNTFGYTSLGETATTSGSGSTVTGIPSTATEVIIILTDVSLNGSNTPHLLLQMGSGSIDTTNNYKWETEYAASNESLSGQPHIRLLHSGWNNANNIYNGIIRILFGASNIQGTASIHPRGTVRNDTIFTYTGNTTIDRVSLSTASGFDAGKYEVLHNG